MNQGSSSADVNLGKASCSNARPLGLFLLLSANTCQVKYNPWVQREDYRSDIETRN